MFGASDGGADQNRHLVAPELEAALDTFPRFDFNDEVLAMIRGAMASGLMPRPELSDDQKSVRCEERFIPGSEAAPDVRVLLYTPPNAKPAGNPGYLHIHGGGYIMGIPK